jgi:hypothetical protein
MMLMTLMALMTLMLMLLPRSRSRPGYHVLLLKLGGTRQVPSPWAAHSMAVIMKHTFKVAYSNLDLQ